MMFFPAKINPICLSDELLLLFFLYVFNVKTPNSDKLTLKLITSFGLDL